MTEKGARVLDEADARLAALDAAFGEGVPDLTLALQGLHDEPFGASGGGHGGRAMRKFQLN